MLYDFLLHICFKDNAFWSIFLVQQKYKFQSLLNNVGNTFYVSFKGSTISSTIVASIFCIKRSPVKWYSTIQRQVGHLFLTYLNVARYFIVPPVEIILWCFTLMQHLALKENCNHLNNETPWQYFSQVG